MELMAMSIAAWDERTDFGLSPAFAETQKADRWLLAGSIVCGSVVLAPIGLLIIIYAMMRL